MGCSPKWPTRQGEYRRRSQNPRQIEGDLGKGSWFQSARRSLIGMAGTDEIFDGHVF